MKKANYVDSNGKIMTFDKRSGFSNKKDEDEPNESLETYKRMKLGMTTALQTGEIHRHHMNKHSNLLS